MKINIYGIIKKNIVENGLFIQSWIFLVNKIIKKIDFKKDISILEIGSGKGCFTKKIIKKMSKNSSLDIFEIKKEYNKHILKNIKNKNANISIYNNCISRLENITNYKKYDYIISSLPLRNFEIFFKNEKMLKNILKQIKNSLKKNGTYIQYQYSKNNKKDIEEIFQKSLDEIDFEFFNIPPAFIYTIRNE